MIICKQILCCNFGWNSFQTSILASPASRLLCKRWKFTSEFLSYTCSFCITVVFILSIAVMVNQFFIKEYTFLYWKMERHLRYGCHLRNLPCCLLISLCKVSSLYVVIKNLKYFWICFYGNCWYIISSFPCTLKWFSIVFFIHFSFPYLTLNLWNNGSLQEVRLFLIKICLMSQRTPK